MNQREIPTYMPESTSEVDLRVASKVCNDNKTVSDDSGMTNDIKWVFAMDIFECEDCTLFTPIDFAAIYATDDPLQCEAGAYVADLRAQYLRQRLAKEPTDLECHALYVKNRQWYGRLKERVSLEALRSLTKQMPLT